MTKLQQLILVFTLGLFVGAGAIIIYGGIKKNAAEKPEDDAAVMAIIKTQMQQIQAARSDQAKKQAIMAMMDEVLKLFLIDISLRTEALQAQCSPPAGVSGAASQAAQSVSPGAASLKSVGAAKTVATAEIPQLSAEREFLRLSSEPEAIKELDKMVYPDLFDQVRKMLPMQRLQIEAMVGNWMGPIEYFESHNPENLRLELARKGATEFKTLVEIVRPNNQNSTTTGDGELHNFNSMGDGSQGVLIGFDGGNMQLQAYYLPGLNAWYGIVYRKAGGKIVPVAKVRLREQL